MSTCFTPLFRFVPMKKCLKKVYDRKLAIPVENKETYFALCGESRGPLLIFHFKFVSIKLTFPLLTCVSQVHSIMIRTQTWSFFSYFCFITWARLMHLGSLSGFCNLTTENRMRFVTIYQYLSWKKTKACLRTPIVILATSERASFTSQKTELTGSICTTLWNRPSHSFIHSGLRMMR